MPNEVILKAENFAKQVLGNDSTGHDWYHVDRVRKNALYICEQENSGDRFTIELAALLHDIADEKLNSSEKVGLRKLTDFLDSTNIDSFTKEQIINIVSTISFKGGRHQELSSIEAKIVQDADRLDAIGAIGIARTFSYGGKKGQAIFDPSIETRHEMTLEEYRNGKSSSIHHFYEKLLKLKSRLHTNAAKRIAEHRHQFMEQFLQQFYKEWEGRT